MSKKDTQTELDFVKEMDFLREGTKIGYNNALCYWDSIPWWFLKSTTINSENKDKLKKIIKFKIPGPESRESQVELTIVPAQIEKGNDLVQVVCGELDKNVESCIRYMIAQDIQGNEIDPFEEEIQTSSSSTNVIKLSITTTIYRIIEELKKRGHQYSYPQVKEALDKLSQTQIKITSVVQEKNNTKSILVSPETILTYTLEETVKRKDKKIIGNKLLITLNTLASKSILEGMYYSYDWSTELKLQGFAGWLYKHLHMRIRNAHNDFIYHFKLSNLYFYSPLTEASGVKGNLKIIERALTAISEYNEGSDQFGGQSGKILSEITAFTVEKNDELRGLDEICEGNKLLKLEKRDFYWIKKEFMVDGGRGRPKLSDAVFYIAIGDKVINHILAENKRRKDAGRSLKSSNRNLID